MSLSKPRGKEHLHIVASGAGQVAVEQMSPEMIARLKVLGYLK